MLEVIWIREELQRFIACVCACAADCKIILKDLHFTTLSSQRKSTIMRARLALSQSSVGCPSQNLRIYCFLTTTSIPQNQSQHVTPHPPAPLKITTGSPNFFQRTLQASILVII